MLLNYYGYNISVREFINNYLIKKPLSENADPHSAFYGDPYGTVYGCFASVIAKSMNKFLKNHKARVIKNKDLEYLIDNYLDYGHPILIWTTIGMLKPTKGNSWFINYTDENATTEKEKKYTCLKHEHCLVLIGYNDNNYIVNDPNQTKDKVFGQYKKTLFEQRYKEMGSEALILEAISNENNLNNNLNKNETLILSKISDFSKGLEIQLSKNETEPIFMLIGSFLNNNEIEKLSQKHEIFNINNQKFYFLGIIEGNILSLIKEVIESVFRKGMILKGIGGELLGVGEMNFGNLADVHILIISYSAIRKGYALAVHEVNVVQSSLKNLHNDLSNFMKNKSKNSSSSSQSKKNKFNIRKMESNDWNNFKILEEKLK